MKTPALARGFFALVTETLRDVPTPCALNDRTIWER